MDHLRSGEDGVGAKIDLSGNGTLNIAVQNGMNTVQQNLDAVNAQIQTIVQSVRTDMDAVVKQSSEVLQTASSVTTEVTTMRSDLNNFQNEFSTYQRFDETGLTIGKTENGQDTGMQLHLSNEKLSFMDSDTEVAYMSGKKLYITEARITDRLAIAVMRKGYFDWIATGDGLGLKWRAAGTE